MAETYLTADDYFNSYQGSVLSEDEAERALLRASRHVDTLTFNRIVAIGFEHLTPFQQMHIRDVVCVLAEFEKENEDLICSAFSSYSINGVSMNLANSTNVVIQNGVVIPSMLYSQLEQTGLTNRVLRRW